MSGLAESPQVAAPHAATKRRGGSLDAKAGEDFAKRLAGLHLAQFFGLGNRKQWLELQVLDMRSIRKRREDTKNPSIGVAQRRLARKFNCLPRLKAR
jgi:hypothetical protein